MSHWCDCDPNVATRKIASKGNGAVAIVCLYSYLHYICEHCTYCKGILGVENIGYPVLYCKAPLVFFIRIVGFVHCRNLGFNICTIFHFCIAHCTIAQLHILGVDQDLGIA